MKKSIPILSILSILPFLIFAQATFIIESLPDYTPPEDILYIAGDFQGWNPGDTAYALQKNTADQWFIELDEMPNGTTINYKFTRGDWGTVEKGEFGEEIPNREFVFGNGETVNVIILNWADYGGGGSTAAENVSVIAEDFYMPQLDRNRRIWLYLPPGYDESSENYPVIYMHDGQNLFDTYTSYAGEWEVDETLNELSDEGYAVPIVVGIDNGGGDRINEYTPWINTEYGGGQGSLYMDFIVETLKPYIDENYRTLPDKESTAIWGSSLGGLISQFGIFSFPDVFSKAGIYSPSYWWSDTVWTFTQNSGYHEGLRLYQMTGSLEGGSMVQNTWDMHDTLTDQGFDDTELASKIVEGGQHNEQLWREDFAEAYLWLFESFANAIDEHPMKLKLMVKPNPASDRIILPGYTVQKNADFKIYSISGELVKSEQLISDTIAISSLNCGLYLLEVHSGKYLFQGKFLKK
jgi:predicted alpha/beta superfamily hydrolase